MTSHLTLSLLDAEITAARTRLSMLRDELGAHRGRAEELMVRSFIAETPFADREYHIAEARVRQLETRARDEESQLLALLEERERLGEGTGAGNPRARGTA